MPTIGEETVPLRETSKGNFMSERVHLRYQMPKNEGMWKTSVQKEGENLQFKIKFSNEIIWSTSGIKFSDGFYLKSISNSIKHIFDDCDRKTADLHIFDGLRVGMFLFLTLH